MMPHLIGGSFSGSLVAAASASAAAAAAPRCLRLRCCCCLCCLPLRLQLCLVLGLPKDGRQVARARSANEAVRTHSWAAAPANQMHDTHGSGWRSVNVMGGSPEALAGHRLLVHGSTQQLLNKTSTQESKSRGRQSRDKSRDRAEREQSRAEQSREQSQYIARQDAAALQTGQTDPAVLPSLDLFSRA